MNPLAFYAASALLVLAGIYLFRRRSRDVKVSTLMFWTQVKTPAEGGRKITMPQTPLILLIELLILSLFIAAAADPRAIIGEELMPLVVILDDSFSMTAGEEKSAHDKALTFLESEVLSSNYYRISLIRAGTRPEFIGRRDMRPAEARQLITNWRCQSPSANLDEAIKLASESFQKGTRILVITDAQAASTLAENISWHGFGSSLPNLAITAANRYSLGKVDRCFVEFSNFSDEPADLQADIVDISRNLIIQKLNFKMSPDSVRRVRFSLPSINSVITAQIKNDPHVFDNQVWLMPVRKPKVKVALKNLTSRLDFLMKKTIDAAENAVLANANSDILFSQNPDQMADNFNSWNFYFNVASQPVLARGVITVAKTHPVCDGLPQTRGAWAMNSKTEMPGFPLLSIGNHTLLSLFDTEAGRREFYMNFVADYSTIQQTSFWPVLFWNLFAWRQSLKPGPADFNFRSGMEVAVNAPEGEIVLTHPNGKKEQLPAWQGTCSFVPGETGLYQITAEQASWTVAVNLVSHQESNLTTRGQFTPPDNSQVDQLIKHSSDVRWWFIIPALLLLIFHQWLISRRRQQYVY
jgi:hypothetical protein